MEWFFAALTVIAIGLFISLLLVQINGRSWLSRKRRHTAVVHTQDGDSLRGVLVESDSFGLCLDKGTHLDSGSSIGGSTWVPVQNVRWVQIDPPGAND